MVTVEIYKFDYMARDHGLPFRVLLFVICVFSNQINKGGM